MKFLEKVAVFLKLKEHDADFKPEHLKFGEVTLESGDMLIYDGEELSVGMVVAIVTPDGSLPAADGEYTSVDGTIIVVSGGEGVVSDIIAPAADEPVEAPVADAPAVVADVPQEQVAKRDVERIIKERERVFNEEKEKEIAELNFAHEKKVAELTELLTKQNEVIAKFKSEPAAKPVKEKFGIKKKGVPNWFAEGLKNK